MLKIPGYQGSGDCLLKLPFEEIVTIMIPSLRKWEQSEQKIINVIEKTKNLRTFEYGTANVNVFTVLASNCKNLTDLHLKLDYNSRIEDLDKKLSRIFKNNEKIKSLKLENFHAITGECFLLLNKNIVEVIGLIRISNIQRDFLIKSLPKFTKLRTLDLSIIGHTAYDHLIECINLCQNLKRLTIMDKRFNKDFNRICFPKKIEWLNIFLNEEQPIAESFLDYLSRNLLELKYLCIFGNIRNISSYKFDLNCKFQKLEALEISWQSKFTGSGLENFPNLKKFSCFEGENLDDENVINLLKCANNLESLNVRGCKKITNAVVNTALELTRKRTNGVMLTIGTFGTKINIDEILEKSPLLRLA